MRVTVTIAFILLAACTSEAEHQANEYTIMRRTAATSAELCAKARTIAEIHRSEENTAKYEEWDYKADIHCLDERLGI